LIDAFNDQVMESTQDPRYLLEVFSTFKPRIVTQSIFDFSVLRKSSDTFCEVSPTSIDEVCEIVQLAFQHNIPLRTRGQGHSMNGSSLPSDRELLVQIRNLAGIRYEEEGTVTVGAGIVVWTLQELLSTYNYVLPVIHDGYPAASVGGYISAGGFGANSKLYGGFWENVVQITLVTGRGQIQYVTRDEPLFPWLFGAMGQLGIIVEVKLDIIATGTMQPLYPQGLTIPWDTILEEEMLHGSGPPESERGRRLYWFTFFVPVKRLDKARSDLMKLQARHIDTFNYREPYVYPIKHRRVVPPLVYPDAKSFIAVGIWGYHEDETLAGLRKLKALDSEVARLARENGYRQYIQGELSSGVELYEQYFGQDTYTRFHELKLRQDPKLLLNRGSVFRAA
jgi:FAD/FMN-containing dehydrogenase